MSYSDIEHKELYKKQLMDHFKSPYNNKELKNPDMYKQCANAMCGDSVSVYIRLSDNTRADITFQGAGCIISQASASIMCQAYEGWTIEKICQQTEQDMLNKVHMSLRSSRKECALLAFKCLQQLLCKR
jgi:nitrogen fixation NifU-like protein